MTGGHGPWRLDDTTLNRLTWLWLAYTGFALTVERRRFPSVCPFRLVTGHACPLCGLTRSVAYVLHGRMRYALEQHPAGPVLFAGSGFFLAAAWLSRSLAKRRSRTQASAALLTWKAIQLPDTSPMCGPDDDDGPGRGLSQC